MLTMTIPGQIFPICQKTHEPDKMGLWTDYEKVWGKTISHLPITHAVLTVEKNSSYGVMIWRTLDLYFDSESWNTEDYGIIYTDKVFEDAVGAWWQNTLRFPKSYGIPFYTEAGMQGQNHVSMELPTIEKNLPWWAGFASAHEALALLEQNPDITYSIDPSCT